MVLNRKLLMIGATAISVLVTVSACGSSSKNSGGSSPSTSTGTTTTTGSSTASTGSSVKIGVMCSCTGAFGTTVSAAYTAVQDWAKSENAAGGLDGHQIVLDEKDDASNPGTAATDAQTLISSHVTAIIDVDILDEVWEKTADTAKIPVVGGNISSPIFYTDPNFYPAGQTNDSVIYSTFVTAKTAGATNIGLIYCAESPTCAESVPLEKSTGTALGVPVVYSSSIAATAPNYTAQCLAAKQAGATALFIADGVDTTDRVASDCNSQGYKPIYITEGTGYQDLVLTAAGIKDNLWLSFPIQPYFSTDPSVAAMKAVLNQYSPGLITNKTVWSEFAVEGWGAALLLESAAKNADFTTTATVTAADWTNGLTMVSGDTLGGFSPSLTFAAGKGHVVDCWYTAHISNGVPAVVGGQTCHSAS